MTYEIERWKPWSEQERLRGKLSKTDIDNVWRQDNKILFLEVKFGSEEVKMPQFITYENIHGRLKGQKDYYGCHLLRLSLDFPLNFVAMLDGVFVTEDELIEFLWFNAPKERYSRNFVE